MADKQKTPKPKKTPKEKAQESYKVHKEYMKLERRDRLPRFIIILISLILIVGVFVGLSSSYDFDLSGKYVRNFYEIDMISARDSLSDNVRVSFYSFFSSLSSLSHSLDVTRSAVLSSYSPDFFISQEYTDYISQLYYDSCVYIDKNNDSVIKRWWFKQQLKHEFIDVLTGGGKWKTEFRANEILHNRNIPFIDIDFGVDLLSLHNNLISYSVCHCYNDILYCYCEN